MFWHLLNQCYVSMDYKNSRVSVLEEVLSSDLQLVLVLASGRISTKTMNSVLLARCSPVDHREVL